MRDVEFINFDTLYTDQNYKIKHYDYVSIHVAAMHIAHCMHGSMVYNLVVFFWIISLNIIVEWTINIRFFNFLCVGDTIGILQFLPNIYDGEILARYSNVYQCRIPRFCKHLIFLNEHIWSKILVWR